MSTSPPSRDGRIATTLEPAYGDDRHRLLLTAQAFEAACMRLDQVPNDADTDGRVMPGIVFARNRGAHYRALMLRNRYGTELGTWILGKGLLGMTTRLVWRDRAELPQGRSNYGEAVYERHLEAQPVRDIIGAARRWMHGGARGEGPLFFPIAS